MKMHSIAGALADLAFAAAQTPASPQTSPLPGGATSLQETYQDWQVACVAQANAKRCGLSQQQTGQNRQRVLAIELALGDGNSLTGTLILPFGLLLDIGVAAQIDDKPVGKPLRFRTCLPVGCILPLHFEGATAAALRAGTILKFIATPNERSESITFAVSLKGFAAALNRTAVLVK